MSDWSENDLNRLFSEGILDRPSRGLYTLPDAAPSEHRSIIEACKLVPHGTICLLTALRFHDLTTQSPFEIWMAIDEKARHPKIDSPPRFASFAFQGQH
jgi:predicted transcriptional regulator of viral defense system